MKVPFPVYESAISDLLTLLWQAEWPFYVAKKNLRGGILNFYLDAFLCRSFGSREQQKCPSDEAFCVRFIFRTAGENYIRHFTKHR